MTFSLSALVSAAAAAAAVSTMAAYKFWEARAAATAGVRRSEAESAESERKRGGKFVVAVHMQQFYHRMQ